MKQTESSEYIKEVRAEMRKISAALKQIEVAERAQDEATNVSDCTKANNEAQCANLELMSALEEMVRLASAMSSISGVTNTFTAHKIVEYDLRTKSK